jgi:hypothetical protein
MIRVIFAAPRKYILARAPYVRQRIGMSGENEVWVWLRTVQRCAATWQGYCFLVPTTANVAPWGSRPRMIHS